MDDERTALHRAREHASALNDAMEDGASLDVDQTMAAVQAYATLALAEELRRIRLAGR